MKMNNPHNSDTFNINDLSPEQQKMLIEIRRRKTELLLEIQDEDEKEEKPSLSAIDATTDEDRNTASPASSTCGGSATPVDKGAKETQEEPDEEKDISYHFLVPITDEDRNTETSRASAVPDDNGAKGTPEEPDEEKDIPYHFLMPITEEDRDTSAPLSAPASGRSSAVPSHDESAKGTLEEPFDLFSIMKDRFNREEPSTRYHYLAKNWAEKLKSLKQNDQRIIAEKLINDVLFDAELGTLTRSSQVTTQHFLQEGSRNSSLQQQSFNPTHSTGVPVERSVTNTTRPHLRLIRPVASYSTESSSSKNQGKNRVAPKKRRKCQGLTSNSK